MGAAAVPRTDLDHRQPTVRPARSVGILVYGTGLPIQRRRCLRASAKFQEVHVHQSYPPELSYRGVLGLRPVPDAKREAALDTLCVPSLGASSGETCEGRSSFNTPALRNEAQPPVA